MGILKVELENESLWAGNRCIVVYLSNCYGKCPTCQHKKLNSPFSLAPETVVRYLEAMRDRIAKPTGMVITGCEPMMEPRSVSMLASCAGATFNVPVMLITSLIPVKLNQSAFSRISHFRVKIPADRQDLYKYIEVESAAAIGVRLTDVFNDNMKTLSQAFNTPRSNDRRENLLADRVSMDFYTILTHRDTPLEKLEAMSDWLETLKLEKVPWRVMPYDSSKVTAVDAKLSMEPQYTQEELLDIVMATGAKVRRMQ